MNTTSTEEAIRGLGVKTDVATAASIFGISQTRAYERIKNGTFPVPVITPIPAAWPCLSPDPAPAAHRHGSAEPAWAVNPHELAALVAEKVVSRLAAAIAAQRAPGSSAARRCPAPPLKRAPTATTRRPPRQAAGPGADQNTRATDLQHDPAQRKAR